ncbi:integrase [Rhodoblastus acidophilus]|uniref:tyrosine-type recombinase/integrase n=1 Tax=Rhodoblastus acidophilus TaxID=1074 RepID=UPI0022242265|nr:site-specific integrase [Rhodoblastus acidophilus]MCW2286676.1 integrase [Rhodoblastus acidophilus]MCW2335496.1 integrase [Rhodoblastus acidophilus]
MSRASKGARLWLRPADRDESGNIKKAARWIILDGGKQIATGAADREEAEKALAVHLVGKHSPARTEQPLSAILITDVLKIYLEDRVPGQARPENAAERLIRLGEFFSGKTLNDITGKLCREYVAAREGKGRSNKGKGGSARRDLEDLRAAINHHHKEGYHREVVRVVLPAAGKARQRWLTRDEFAKLLWTCWRTREWQKVHHDGKEDGERKATDKRPLRHLCRLLLMGVYTGSRPGAIFSASWTDGDGRSHVDLTHKVFHRHAGGAIETNKRQPSVKLSSRLTAHLKRWKRLDKKAGENTGFVVRFNGAQATDFDTSIKRALKLANITGNVTAYSLRHTCASWLVQKGLPTRKIADFLGTSEQMIIRHYGHLAPDYQDEAAEMIGRK